MPADFSGTETVLPRALSRIISQSAGQRLTPGHYLMIALLAVLMTVLSAVVDFSTPPPPWRLPAAGALFGVILVMCGFRIGKFSARAMLILFFWAGYASMGVVAALINRDNLFGELWQLVGVPLVIFAVIPHYIKKHGVIVVTRALVLGAAPFIIVSLALHPIHQGYSGVYTNPNAMGLVAVTWLAGLLVLMRKHVVNKNKRLSDCVYLSLSGAAAAVALVLIIASNSRTSLITAAILITVFFLTVFDLSRKRTWVLSAVAALGLFLFLTLAIAGVFQFDLLSEQMDKFRSELGAVSGREVIWKNVLDNFSVFGHGGTSLNNRVGAPAHNTYMEVLDARGIFGLVFRLLFDMAAIALAYKIAVRRSKEDAYAVGPFLVIVNYMVLGLTENVNGTLGSGIHVAFLLMVGVAMHYDHYH
jgi:hypothetical protein